MRLTAARQTVAARKPSGSSPLGARRGRSSATETRAAQVRGDNMILPKNALVSLRGIQSKPALNGSKGLVQSWDGDAQRYVVRTQSEQLKLKLANVELA